MLALRPNCECCDKDLPPAAADAMICTFECTFCRDCVETALKGRCPNCGGNFSARPIRPLEKLEKYPPSTQRVNKAQGCGKALAEGIGAFAALFLFFMATQPALAKDWCEPQFSNLNYIDGVDVNFNSQLIACGREANGFLVELTILYINNNKKMVAFEGDLAKGYRIERSGDGYSIQESIDNLPPLKPFVEVRATCDAKGVCGNIDSTCLWRKQRSEHALERLKDTPTSDPVKVAAAIKDIFKDAIGGDADAALWFSQNHFFSGDALETFTTYKTDIARLKKLNCI